LGRLTKVDLRTVWPNEAQDFTPWLADPDHLGLLGDTIGLDLELEGTEQSVGPFSADLLCKDTLEDRWVVIENQLARTDHTHLGQLLTYAAGLDAATIVWIAERFTDEHRAALDWLNELTDDTTYFFGLEIELWQIGDSPPAPKFNLASKPNNWSKSVTRAARDPGELTPTKQMQLDYWRSLKSHLEQNSRVISPRKPRAQHWANFAVGRSGAQLTARMHSQKHLLTVEVVMYEAQESEALFHLLEEEKEQIEAEVGQSLDWLPKPEKQRCAISAEWSANPADRDDWPQQHARITDMLETFYRVFSPRLKRLDVDEWRPPNSESAGA
jgi:hypothetical protein